MEAARITADGGCKFIDSASTSVGAYCFVVNSDCVLTTLSGGTSPSATSTNFITTIGLSGKTLKQGTLIFAPEGYLFNSITPSSGSVIAYKLEADIL
jgi:hypothetical protein